MIYIYRNPKDVTVSLFHFLRSINIELTYSGPWNQFVKSFLIDEIYYAPWWKHVNDYHSIQDKIFFVSYEELLTVCWKFLLDYVFCLKHISLEFSRNCSSFSEIFRKR